MFCRTNLPHNVTLMSLRLLPALVLSLLLHAGVLWWPGIEFSAALPRPLLEATLRLPAKPPPVSDEALLKNTLAAVPTPPASKPPPLPSVTRAASPLARATARRQVEAAQRKLSQHLYYPPAAVAGGIEGEVRLILKLSDDGSIVDVDVAASSGHILLDQAAIKAAYAMGRVNWAPSRELILPVIFRLE